MVSAVSQMKIKLLRFVVVVVVVVRLLCWQLLNRRYLVADAIAGDIKCQTVCKMENHDVMIGVRYSSIGNGNSNSTINTTEKKIIPNKQKETPCKSETWLGGLYSLRETNVSPILCKHLQHFSLTLSSHSNQCRNWNSSFLLYYARKRTPALWESRASCKLSTEYGG